MTCKYCQSEMHKRGTNAPRSRIEVYVCPRCGAVLYIYDEEVENWSK